MVPLDAPIAHVEGVFNAVVVEGDFVGTVMLEGRGAGAGPTASAVVADLVDVARGPARAGLRRAGRRAGATSRSRRWTAHVGAYYIRLMVLDRPGVIADVSGVLRDEQRLDRIDAPARPRSPGEAVPVVLTTHETDEARDAAARWQRIARLDAVPSRRA